MLRLRGLDCPGLSIRFVEALVAKAVGTTIHTTKRDKYDRYLADTFLPGAERAASGERRLFQKNAVLENAGGCGKTRGYSATGRPSW
jgi:hypothetical protein